MRGFVFTLIVLVILLVLGFVPSTTLAPTLTSAQLQQQIEAAYKAGGGTVTVPVGQHNMMTTIHLRPGVKLVGEARPGSILYAHHSVQWNDPLLKVEGRVPNSTSFGSLWDSLDCPSVENLTLWGQNTSGTGPDHSCLMIVDPGYPSSRTRGTTGMIISGVNCLYGYDGIRVIGDTTHLTIRDCQIVNQTNCGMNLSDGVNSLTRIDNCYIRGSGQHGFYAKNLMGTLTNLTSEGSAFNAFRIEDSHKVVMITPYVEQTQAIPGKTILYLKECKGVRVIEPQFSGYTKTLSIGSCVEIHRCSDVTIDGGFLGAMSEYAVKWSDAIQPGNRWVEDWELGPIIVSSSRFRDVVPTNKPGIVQLLKCLDDRGIVP